MNTDRGYKLVVSVGAGTTQFPFIKALKDKGYRVAAFGRGRNDKEAILLCDYFQEIDTSDHVAAIRWLNSLPEKIVAAGSFAGGVAINTLQEICRYFHLPTKIPEFLSVGMNKFEQQQLYEQYHLSTIRTFKYKDIQNNPNLVGDISHFIIKPSVGRGSAGVYQVNQLQMKQILKEDRLSADDMIQELKDGVEYRMLVIAQDYTLKLLAPIKRDSYHGSFLLGRLSYHSEHIDQIKLYVTKMLRKLNLKDVVLKADIIVNESGIDLIEMDIGVGGGLYFKQYISYLFNYDIINEYIYFITGNEVKSSSTIKEKVVMDYVYNLSGRPIAYDIETCRSKLMEQLGKDVVIIPNRLHPEKSGKFEVNSDFIFCVIHQNQGMKNDELNKFINREIFQEQY